MNRIVFISITFLILLLIFSCQKKEVVHDSICFEKAKEFLKKDNNLFLKGTISKAILDDKPILIIFSEQSGAVSMFDDSCNNIYSCCGKSCDCSFPSWMYDIENKEVIWEKK